LPPAPQLAASVPSSQVLPLQQPEGQVEALQAHRQVPPQPSETSGPQAVQVGLQQVWLKQVKLPPQTVHWSPAAPQAATEAPG
jgi:hypothetical protein